MICRECKEDLKEKSTMRGLRQCDMADCKNLTYGWWHMLCKECSEKNSMCEICGKYYSNYGRD